jgi:tetratricopeptide (TPR) repeat protein
MRIDADIERQLKYLHDRRFANPQRTLVTARALGEHARLAGNDLGVAHALRIAGGANAFLSNFDSAEEDLRRAAEMYSAMGAEVDLHVTYGVLATIRARRGQYTEAIAAYRSALRVFTAFRDRSAEADTLIALGWAYKELACYANALDVLLTAKSLAEAAHDGRALLRALNNIGCTYGALEDYELAEGALQQALRLARELGETADEAAILGNLGSHAGIRHQYEVARAYHEESLGICRLLGLRKAESHLLVDIAEVHIGLGEFQRAADSCNEALLLARASGECMAENIAVIKKGEALLLLGELSGARETLTEGLILAEALSHPELVRDAHRALAAVAESLGDLSRALDHHKAFHGAHLRVRQEQAKLLSRKNRDLEALERTTRETDRRLLQSELRALKAQLEPHFLFNVLNSVAALMHRDVHAAEAMLLHVATLLRMALRQSSGNDVSLGEEIEFVALYLRIEQIRNPDLLEVAIDVPNGLRSARVPHLLLQPLVENAVRHGFREKSERGELRIRAQKTDSGMLEISIEDNGVGLPAGWSKNSTGVGLRNTCERLRLTFGGRYAFDVRSAPTGGTHVSLHLPLVLPCSKSAGAGT